MHDARLNVKSELADFDISSFSYASVMWPPFRLVAEKANSKAPTSLITKLAGVSYNLVAS